MKVVALCPELTPTIVARSQVRLKSFSSTTSTSPSCAIHRQMRPASRDSADRRSKRPKRLSTRPGPGVLERDGAF